MIEIYSPYTLNCCSSHFYVIAYFNRRLIRESSCLTLNGQYFFHLPNFRKICDLNELIVPGQRCFE